jgi:1-aminocyclopropane-1-carboxylate deaminase/D-cysteine desulfhydrase-like pyridoxal-dependent ACC family enzyme
MHPLVAVPVTPVHPLPRLAKAIGLGEDQLWVKREDLTGLAGGGNKARKLQLFAEEARQGGYEALVTGGGPQSNHARITAGAAAILGLDCELVLRKPDDPALSGNLLLDRLLGAKVTWVGALGFDELNQAIVDAAGRHERKALPIPVGGSSLPGAKAYAAVGQELAGQLNFGTVVLATGSGGTQAGLAAGLGEHGRVLGFDVGAQDGIEAFITGLAAKTAAALGLPAPAGQAWVDFGYKGEAYGVPTDACKEALVLAARTEGLLLDPVYTGKAMAGLISCAREGRFGGQRVVFVHTGGLPGLLSERYTKWLAAELGS